MLGPLENLHDGDTIVGGCDRSIAHVDAIDEVFELLAQGFALLETRDDDVTVAHGRNEFGKTALARLVVGAAIVDAELLGRVRVVEYHHLAITDHCHAAHLYRVEPAHVHAGEHAVWVVESHEDDVLGACLQVGLPAGDEVDWVRAQPVAQHREVVRRQIPEGVDVLPDGAETGALEVQVPDLAEQALVDVPLDRAHGGVEQKRVAHHERPAGALLCGHERLGIRHGSGQRLLDEYMYAGVEARLDHLSVCRGRGGHDDGVNVPIAQESSVVGVGASRRVHALERCQPRRRRFCASRKARARHGAGE